MANVLSEEKRKQIEALGLLGWSLRRIEAATGGRRETAGGDLKAAGVPLRRPGKWGWAKPANESITDSAAAGRAKPANESITDSAAAAGEAKPANEAITESEPRLSRGGPGRASACAPFDSEIVE